MPRQERDEGSKVHHHEKWQTGYPGNMPGVRNKDVQDWEGIRVQALGLIERLGIDHNPSLSIMIAQFEFSLHF